MKNRILLGTGSLFNYGLNRTFELAKKAGYFGVELVIDDCWDKRQPTYIKRLTREYKLKIPSVHSAMEFAGCWGGDPKVRLKKSIEIAKEVKAEIIVFHPHDYLDESFYSWVKKNKEAIIKMAKPLRVAFENSTSRRPNHTIRSFGQFPTLVFDTSHFGTTRGDLLKALDKIISKLIHVHISDSDLRRRPDNPKLIADCHLMPGKGKLPLKEFLKRLKELKYQGYIVIELVPESVSAGESDDKVISNLKKARLFVEKHFC